MMEAIGIIGLPVQQTGSIKSPTETVPSSRWVCQEPSLPHLTMEPLGFQGHPVQRKLSMESPTKNNNYRPNTCIK